MNTSMIFYNICPHFPYFSSVFSMYLKLSAISHGPRSLVKSPAQRK